jgi:acetylornithine deacetylase/succinyl-diaminopimelate desuccinylase-like protein
VTANLLPAPAATRDLADSPGIREAMRWFTREKQWVNEIHLQLCRIPAPTFLEQVRAEWFASQMRGLGWHTAIDREGNVLSSLHSHPGDSQPEGQLLAVTAHLDTVLAPKTKEDILVDRDGDFRGPGVSDNGAGLAGLLAIAKSVKSAPRESEIWDRLLLIANVGEEGEGNLRGMRHICGQPELISRIGAFLVLDGAAVDHITTQALGSRRFEISFSGPGGHSWSDFGVGNPVHALSRAVACFIDRNPLDPRASPKVSLNVGIIEGGASVNAIPSSARAKVDIRSENNDRIDELVTALHSAMVGSEEAENTYFIENNITYNRVNGKIKEIGNRPAAFLPPDSPLVKVIRSVDGHLGIRARLDCASTDANIPLSMGIPAVSIGAGGRGGGAHTLAEWYRPDGRDLGLKRILLTAALLLRDPA